MTRPALPPEYVKVDVEWLYGNHQIKEPAKIFYMQLRGLAWGKDCTPWLKMDELEELTGKKHSVIWGYMSTLRTYRRLSWRTSGDGSFMYTFTGDYSEGSEQLRKSGVSSTTTVLKESKPIKDKEEEAAPKVRSTPKVRSVPTNPKEASEHPDIRVFVKASDRYPGQAQYKQIIETIKMLREKLGLNDDQLSEYLREYCVAWNGMKRKDGKPYDRRAIAWCTEWAVNGHIPEARKENKLDIDSILGV